jgi:hypothetical protein
MMVCFERQLTTEWYRISRTIRELANRGQGGVTLWNFLDFVVTYRTPLFLLLFPVIKCKYLLKICDNDVEYGYQQQIREKMSGLGLPFGRSKGCKWTLNDCEINANLILGQLLVQLMSEMRLLREELISRKTLPPVDDRKSIVGDQSSSERPEGHRLSFAFTQMAASASKLSNISSSNSNTPQSHQQSGGEPSVAYNTPTSSKASLLRGLSFRLSARGEQRVFPPRNLSVKLSRDSKRVMEGFLRRTSYPDPKEAAPPGGVEAESRSAQSEPKLFRKSTLHVKRGSKKSAKESSLSPQSLSGEALAEGVTAEDEHEIRAQIARKLSGEGSGSCSRSDSPDEERALKHRLQRQKAQSRKTFRFRKSRRGAGFLQKEEEEDRGRSKEEDRGRSKAEDDTTDGREVALAEEESSSIVERSRDGRDDESSSTELLSPKEPKNASSDESVDESAALLANDESNNTSFPFADEEEDNPFIRD